MKINVEVEIFDDPEYCCTPDGNDGCRYLGSWCCMLFRRDNGNFTMLEEAEQEKKCPACKAAYKKAQVREYRGINR